jgi:conjugative transfer region protein TrbK
MSIRLSARIGAFACLGVALAMGALALREEPKPAPPSFTPSTDLPTDPLQAKIRSCQLAGQAAGSDPGCLAAWAENRRRFLGNRPPEPGTEPGRSTEAATVLDVGQQQEH